jgi:hypothetical protein
MKLCRKCGVEKPLDKFRENSRGYLCSPCTDCRSISNKTYRKNHFERLKKIRQHPEQRKRDTASTRRWQARNPEKARALELAKNHKATQNLSDFYIKSLLRKAGINKEVVPSWFLESYRFYLKAKRLIRGGDA